MAKPLQTVKAGAVLLVICAGWFMVLNARSRPPEADLAAPGAPLYEAAVTESVRNLMTKKELSALEAESRPPSPGPDYYWCEHCKTYHKRPASAQQPDEALQPAATPAEAAERPPSPGPDYYWCEQCRTYHLRPNVAQQPDSPDPPTPANTSTQARTPNAP